eukprot:TRINITY_DN20069_c0_g1_i1.p1 TRINITY_DN20069_c0_g1~~TRINITY_DN20069_c0_g1_i1.p1  ORF type:complete len:906 (+),score=146.07 TRINITY_DN20069_c0_g1_i1:22-2718(+)
MDDMLLVGRGSSSSWRLLLLLTVLGSSFASAASDQDVTSGINLREAPLGANAWENNPNMSQGGFDVTACREQDYKDFWDFSRAFAMGFPMGRDLACCILFIFLMYIVQWYASKTFQHQSEEMELVADADKTVSMILARMSNRRVQSYRFRGLTPKTEPATIQFTGLAATVGKGEKTMLQGVTGTIMSGHLTAIMGPSGAGKTTFLNVLCGKTHDDGNWNVHGEVKINGETKAITDMKPVTGFVPQDDIVHEGLTVRENFLYSAHIRNPRGTPTKRIEKIVADVIKVLQLEAKQNMLVGSRITGDGLSGGQRKRVNVGIELAATPTVLFLDEPTSGLDSTSSLMLIQQLKKMAEMGMTIAMVIHQPRYSLFTLIDDVLLLGMGGRTVYTGPTKGAKGYFESQGFVMPDHENPSDWFMDVMSGQLEQKYSRIPRDRITDALTAAWEQRPQSYDALTRSSSILPSMFTEAEVEQTILHGHIQAAWKEVAPSADSLEKEDFAQVLQKCLSDDGRTDREKPKDVDVEVASEIMRRANQLNRVSRQSSPLSVNTGSRVTNGVADEGTIDLNTFEQYLLRYDMAEINDFEDSSSDSGDDDLTLLSDDESGLLSRTETGFCKHFSIVMTASMVQWWRKMKMRVLFIGIVVFAAMFLACFDRFVFNAPRWSPSTFLNFQITIALLVSVYSLFVFSEDQPMYWREASHGLNRFAFFQGRTLVDTLDWYLMTFFFSMTYYTITVPKLHFRHFFISNLLVAYVASGWGYLISCWLPRIFGPFLTCLLCFTMGGILGLPQQMRVFLGGGFWEVIVDCFSFSRWSASMAFLEYIKQADPRQMACWEEQDFITTNTLPLFLQWYSPEPDGQATLLDMPGTWWWTPLIALLIQGTVLRCIAYFGLRFTNRNKQD